MKKFYLLLLMIFILVFAQQSPDYIEAKIIKKLLIDMSKNQTVKVCTIGYKGEQISDEKIIVTNCKNADFIIIEKDGYPIYTDKPTILVNSDNVNYIKTYVNIIGALYWKKGRPQLIFLKNRLKAYNITLPKEYERFIIEEEKISFVNLKSIIPIYIAEER